MALKENQPRMWDVREYSLVVPGRPGTISEYSRTSHI